jgi:ubiquinone/menaquinone biosynthesis C-methylase UbiE
MSSTVMSSAARLAQFVLGVEGLALLRLWLTGDPAAIEARLQEVRRFAAAMDEPPLSEPVAEPELDTGAGYARWAATYDGPNPLIVQEEEVVRPLLDRAPVGRALDAGCGTGRHAAYLAARGHAVVGVDASPEMLAQARARVPDAEFRLGRLEALPVEDASVDLAICALALTHCIDLEPPLWELARVVRPGGRVLLSDPHPFLVLLGAQALFRDAAGRRAFVRNHAHPHSAYLAAFAATGLAVAQCLEPPDTAAELPWFIPEIEAASRDALSGLPSLLVWDLRRS